MVKGNSKSNAKSVEKKSKKASTVSTENLCENYVNEDDNNCFIKGSLNDSSGNSSNTEEVNNVQSQVTSDSHTNVVDNIDDSNINFINNVESINNNINVNTCHEEENFAEEDLEYYTYNDYKREYDYSIKNKEKYFSDYARKYLSWDKMFTKTYNGDILNAKWFEDGTLNACYNCIDRHVLTMPDKIAIIDENNDLEARYFTFKQAQDEIIKISNFLCCSFNINEDSKFNNDVVKRGIGNTACIVEKDEIKAPFCVAIYMPMCAEAVFSTLACARLGIPHNVIFGGFNAESLAMRINDSNAKLIITVDKTSREKKKIDFLQNVQIALGILKKENAMCVDSVLVFNKEEVFVDLKVNMYLWSDFGRGILKNRSEHTINLFFKESGNLEDKIVVDTNLTSIASLEDQLLKKRKFCNIKTKIHDQNQMNKEEKNASNEQSNNNSYACTNFSAEKIVEKNCEMKETLKTHKTTVKKR
ncbi:hypothetical protein EDEG_01995 [Edhazardia aedis USNM 41457]|uniref:acetate--CoA ligase n=1 Tax=Edhazardia aedis (strain USNM 41457) TaxID=1003232 RepID=J9DM92_EDHAE|nr:hypothetical protein EDEG_01995 [Edhazardia aedis USNM 41457]|eukprot:EJW03715.1 hypothetical protein EDEG_01995 [Edhazardia aedis USNM 41457]